MRTTTLILLFAFASSGDTVLRELIRNGVKQKAIEVSSGSFSEAYIERLARTELDSRPHVNFSQVYIYGDKGGAPLPKPSHVTYDYWRRLHLALERSSIEIAEVISVGSNSVLRIRDAAGRIHRRVLTGHDPLQLDMEGNRFEILYVTFGSMAPFTLQRVDVYIRTDSLLNAQLGAELRKRLQPVFPDLDVSIFVRNDSWFIYQPTYPFVNPLIETAGLPTQEEYAAGKTLTCGGGSSLPCRLE